MKGTEAGLLVHVHGEVSKCDDNKTAYSYTDKIGGDTAK